HAPGRGSGAGALNRTPPFYSADRANFLPNFLPEHPNPARSNVTLTTHFRSTAPCARYLQLSDRIAMQKVVGSSPIIRFSLSPVQAGRHPSRALLECGTLGAFINEVNA